MCDLLSVCKCKCPIICVPPYPADFLNRRRPCPQSFALALVLVSPLALVCVFALVLALPTFHPGVPASPTSRWGKQSRQLSSTFHSDFLHWDHCAHRTGTMHCVQCTDTMQTAVVHRCWQFTTIVHTIGSWRQIGSCIGQSVRFWDKLISVLLCLCISVQL